MIFAGTAAWLMLFFGGADDAPPETGTVYAQVVVRQQIIVRVPRPAPGAPVSPPVQWRESKGPRCIPARAVAGAALLGQNSVDLLLHDRSRVRVRLESGCGGLDFYQGFYVNGTADGMICADRDAVRSRMGGQCGIDGFKMLTAVR
ncbi:MAG TPA: hypothetical protein VEZ20_12765 [Allosphingosinicella sp.]|nr:hypothetical protein [Allosphingosinicella sp.]